jgi:hypothetical protein
MISVGGSRLNSQRLAPVFVSSRHLCFKDLFRSFLTVFLYYQFFFFRLYESDVKKKFTFRQALLESQPGKPDPPFADPHEGGVGAGGLRSPDTRLCMDFHVICFIDESLNQFVQIDRFLIKTDTVHRVCLPELLIPQVKTQEA